MQKQKLSISFIAHLSSLSHDPVPCGITGRKFAQSCVQDHEYFYSYNNSNEDDIYYANLDFPKLKTDGYNFHSLDFAIDAFNVDQVSGGTTTISRKWFIEIMNGVD